MIQRYDTTQQKRVDVSQIRRYDGSNWVDVQFVRRYDSSTGKWVDCLNDYEFTSYTHESPGGAVEVISADGSMVTITVPENNAGGTDFKFETSIPASAVGNDLTISFTMNSLYSGNLSSDAKGSIYITCRSLGAYVIGDFYDTGTDTNFSYTVTGSAVEDRVRLTVSLNGFGDFSGNGTYTIVLKNVVINGKPCKFNF